MPVLINMSIFADVRNMLLRWATLWNESMDRLSREQRHKNMAAIHGKDTKPEMVVRRWLWSRGFRYRLNSPRLPGHPDLVLKKYRTCIFVNGCFWHGHYVDMSGTIVNSNCCKIPVANREYWVNKLRRNQQRDVEVQRQLSAMGWYSITVWECELKPSVREKTLTMLEYSLNSIWLKDHSRCKPYAPVAEEGAEQMAAEPDLQGFSKH